MGYGRKFNGDIICWKDGAMEDHLAIFDAAIEEYPIDTDRLGFTGGSYGGYMTMKLLGRTDTFTAAVAQRALANPVTSYGTGDMGFISSRPVPGDFKMRDYLVDRAEGNIISYVDNMKTSFGYCMQRMITDAALNRRSRYSFRCMREIRRYRFVW